MTPEERRIYDRMNEREKRAVDAVRPEIRGLTLVLWDRMQAELPRMGPPDDGWKRAPRRETVDPQKRRPPEDDGRYGR
jgi:hypothetical protein